jgi:hypothetical protein
MRPHHNSNNVTISTVTHKTVDLSNGETLTITSTGAIKPKTGKVGVVIPAGVTKAEVLNQGKIFGGVGKAGGANANGGTGADAVTMLANDTVYNTGLIQGGAGGTGKVGGNGGAGVYLNAGTLITAGTISGGAGGKGTSGNGTQGDAVQFGAGGATLEVLAGAQFNGLVVADASAADTLALGGANPGTLSGIGSAFLNFATVTEAQKAAWTLAGTDTLGQAALNIYGDLSITGSTSVSGTTIIQGANRNSVASLTVTGVLVNSGDLIDKITTGQHGASGYFDAFSVSGSLTNTGIIVADTYLAGGDLTNSGTMTAIEYGNAVSCIGGTVVNTGSIIGGNSGYYYFFGGSGVYLHGGVLDNSGTITGGVNTAGGDSGPGVLVSDGTVYNHGTLVGGGADIGFAFFCGNGADVLSGGRVVNYSTIVGGSVGAIGGTGATLYGGALTNLGTITGGAGDSETTPFCAGLLIKQGVVANAGTVSGGAFSSTGQGYAGDGVFIEQGALSNTGTIIGGAGAGKEVFGGSGIYMLAGVAGGVIINSGAVTGGYGVYAAGDGAVDKSGTLVNGGLITGGASPGSAGVGVYLGGTGSFSNYGTVIGGAGSTRGGAGIDLTVGTLTTYGGTILGGNGGTGTGGDGVVVVGATLYAFFGTIAGGAGGTGGVGVYLNGSTLVADNDIIGANGADAVLVGSKGGTVTLAPGAQFTGNVVGNYADADTLNFVGTAFGNGVITGFGKSFEGFATVNFEAGSSRFMEGTNAFNAGANVSLDGLLELSGTLTDSANITGTGELFIQDSATLTLNGSEIGVSSLYIQSFTNSATVSGFGTITSPTDINHYGGIITASGGVLDLAGTVYGSYGPAVFQANSGSTLAITGGGTIIGTVAGPGSVDISTALTIDGATTLSATTIIDTASLTLGASAAVTNTSTGFSFIASSGSTISLSGSAGDIVTNTGTLTAAGAGTESITTSFTNQGLVKIETGTLSVGSDIAGTGTLQIATGATLALLDGAATGQLVDFAAGTGALDLTNPLTFLGSIEGFASKDVIDLVNTAATSLTYSNQVLTVDNGATAVAKLTFVGSYKQSDFAIGSDGHGGTNITFV